MENVGSLAPLVWVVFVASAMLATALGAILSYHWFRHAMNHLAAMSALVVYTIGCVFFLTLLFAAALSL